jgi:hypothetical protein
MGADLSEANLGGADLMSAVLSGAILYKASLYRADLYGANLSGADLSEANLSDLYFANLTGANLTDAHLLNANLTNTIGLTKPMGVNTGDIYWKRFGNFLINEGYPFKVGLNKLRLGEVFASDERVLCSYPGFHFASREWCDKRYPYRPYEAKIRIPVDAKVNEPWATDGKASADKIEILQMFEVKTEKDLTDSFKR